MIYVAHDFYSNFNNGVASGDTELSLNILKSELSDLLVYSFDKLTELFDKLGIKYRKSYSDEEILHIVLEELKTNDKFVRGLAFLINDNNDVIKKNPDKKWTDLLNTISDGLKKTSTELVDNPRLQSVFEKDTLAMIATKAEKVGNRTRQIKESDNTLAWTLVIIGLGVTAYLVIKHFQNKKEHELYLKSLQPVAPKMEAGGSAPDINGAAGNQVGTPQAPVVAKPVNPMANDPAYNVSPNVLLPAQPVNQAVNNQNINQVGNGYQQMNGSAPMNNMNMPNNNMQSNMPTMQNNQTFMNGGQQNMMNQPMQNRM